MPFLWRHKNLKKKLFQVNRLLNIAEAEVLHTYKNFLNLERYSAKSSHILSNLIKYQTRASLIVDMNYL